MKKNTDFKDLFKKNNWYYEKSKHKDLISDYELGHLVDQGNIIKMKAGVYRWIEIYSEGQEDLIDLSKIVPRGVFCLYTAMYFHDLTSFVSSKYYLAIPRNRRIPTGVENYPVEIKKWKDNFFDLGIDLKQFGDFYIRIYNREKTVCDCVRFRKDIGQDTLKEVLNSYFNSSQKNYMKLMQYAAALNIKQILEEYSSMLI